MKKRNPEAVITAIRYAVASDPEQRVGQIISNALAVAHQDCDPFYVEDEELAAALRAYAEVKP